MKKPPSLHDEQQRMHALHRYQILDTPQEESFDRITRLLAAYLDVPIALISLVDCSRQWFKSSIGMQTRETDRDLAFCAHTIAKGELMEVADTAQDERFADSPLVTGEPHIRFYAGMPLITTDGFKLGTLCAIDSTPRTLNQQQKDCLKDLAAMVMEAMELRLVGIQAHEDISAHVQSKISLQDELQLVSHIFDNVAVPLITFDQDQNIQSANAAALKLFSCDRSGLQQSKFHDLFLQPHDTAMKIPRTASISTEREVYHHKIEKAAGKRPDDSSFPVNIELVEIPQPTGSTYIATLIDITNRGMIDKAISRSRSSLDLTQNFVFLFDIDTLRFTYSNYGATKHIGYSAEELLDLTLLDVDHDMNEARLREMLLPLLSGEQQDVVYESVHRTKHGEMVPVHLALQVNNLDNDSPIVAVIIGTDISETKRINQEILDSESRLRAIVDTAVDAIITISDSGIIESCNLAAENLFGYTKTELAGQNVKILMPDHYAREHDGYLQKYQQTREAKVIGIGREVIGRRKGGNEFPMELSVGEVQLGDARLYTGIVRDITTRKRAESDLFEAKAAAERANNAKSDFLSRMSHELRTPLNAIIGFGEIMKLDSLQPAQYEYIEHILNAGNHLSALINEVLEIARIEAGQQNFSIEPVGIEAVLTETLGLIKPMADGRAITLSKSPDITQDTFVMADLQRLKQIFLNLLSNAIKYNHYGGEVKILGTLLERNTVFRISVQDNGPGIAKQDHSRVFEVFERLKSVNEDEEGSGVGLALSKALVLAMGGKMGLESEINAGATFWLELPWAAAPTFGAKVPVNNASSWERRVAATSNAFSVLYIEDNISNLRLVEAVLNKRPDIILSTAMKGRLGLDIARTNPPDLILLDLNLPDMQGDEILTVLRTEPATSDIPIIIVSADATKYRKEQLIGIGADAYITKPINIPSFVSAIDSLLLTNK